MKVRPKTLKPKNEKRWFGIPRWVLIIVAPPLVAAAAAIITGLMNHGKPAPYNNVQVSSNSLNNAILTGNTANIIAVDNAQVAPQNNVEVGSNSSNFPILSANTASNINVNIASNINNSPSTTFNINGGNNQFGTGNVQNIYPVVTNQTRTLIANPYEAMSLFYQPLDTSIRSELVGALSTIQKQYGSKRLIVSFRSLNHNKNTRLLQDEWINILNEAGMDASVGFTGTAFGSGDPPDVKLGCNGDDIKIAEAFAVAMQRFVNVKFAGATDMPKGIIELTINADPVFSTNGVAVFK
jgi:hypothetical protein